MSVHLALLDPDANDAEVDEFVAALTGEERHLSGHHDQGAHGKWSHGGEKTLSAPTDLDNYNDIGRARIQRNIDETAAYGLAHGTPGMPTTPEGAADAVLKKYAEATPDQIARGEAWYQDVHDRTAQVAADNGFTIEQGAAVTAVLSPRRTWETNEPAAKMVMDVVGQNKPFVLTQDKWDKLHVKPAGLEPGKTYLPSDLDPRTLAFVHPGFDNPIVHAAKTGWTSQVESGIKVLRAPKDDITVIDREVSGPKRRNFYNNIYDPKDPVSVCIDTHQIRAEIPDGVKLGMATVKDPKTGVSKKVEVTSDNVDTSFFYDYGSAKGGIQGRTGSYAFFASGMQIAAQRITASGHPITPAQVQAVTWLVQMEGGK